MKYIEAAGKKLIFIERGGFPKLSTNERMLVQQDWEHKNREGHLFNGGIYCCNGLIQMGNLVLAWVNSSDYATYVWARKNKLPIPGAYAMGTGTFIYDPDQGYAFAVRTKNVAFDDHTISATSGGVIEHIPSQKPRMKKFLNFVRGQANRETREELCITDLGDETFLGMYLDEKTYKLEFAFTANAHVNRKRGNENSKLTFVSKGKVHDFYQYNNYRMKESTRKHLEHWAKRLDEAE